MRVLDRPILFNQGSRREPNSLYSLPTPSIPSLCFPKTAPSAVLCLKQKRRIEACCTPKNDSPEESGRNGADASSEDDLEKALNLEETIPGSPSEFVQKVSSRAYDMRRNLHQSLDSSSYDVLEANPWRDSSKPVYVLTHGENELCTMKTRRARSEVERELGMLLSQKRRQLRSETRFQMAVEDVREGVLVFEDVDEAVRYCDLLEGGCEGLAEIEASSVFDMCRKMKALAVLFRRGRIHPQPKSLELYLRGRKRSLEDQDDMV